MAVFAQVCLRRSYGSRSVLVSVYLTVASAANAAASRSRTGSVVDERFLLPLPFLFSHPLLMSLCELRWLL